MSLFRFFQITVLLSATSTIGLADSGQDSFRISSIRIAGLNRTSESIVLQEFELKPNQFVGTNDVEHAVQRLRNTNLFTEVSAKLIDDVEGKAIGITLSERWTTIPILKFSSGGGVNQFILGVYDPNTFGRRLELGAQFERLGQANSGVAWLRYPRLFGERIKLDIQTWRTNRLRTKYVQGPIDPEVLTGFLQTRTRLVGGLDFEVVPWFSLGTFVEYHKDRFSDRYLNEDTKVKANEKGLPVGTQVVQRGYRFSLGRMNSLEWQQEGVLFNAAYIQNHSMTDGVDDFKTMEADLNWKWQFWRDALFAQRTMGGWTDTKVLQYWYYLGGLDRIRGFSDNRFAGSKYWLSNSEVRVPVYRTGPVIFQHVTFYDVAATAEDTKALNKASGASAGMGMRVIAPKIYRFVARLDFAYNLVRRDEMPISFGVQQFF